MSNDVVKLVIADIEVQRNRTGYTLKKVLSMYGIKRSTYHGWKSAQSLVNATRSSCFSLLTEEEDAIIGFRRLHQNVGYRKLTWMLNDANIAYATEPAAYRVLKEHDMLGRWNNPDSATAGKEYKEKPIRVHQHWHTDISYIKVKGVFYFLAVVLDGYSRFILDWELMPDMLGSSVEDLIIRVKEKYPVNDVSIVSDNGPQFISRDFKSLLSNLEVQHIRTRRNHPQTNGKLERFNGLIKQEAIRPSAPASYQDACNVITEYIYYYNYQRLHSGIKFLRPADVFFGRDIEILATRRYNLCLARQHRKLINQAAKVPLISDFKKSDFARA